MYRTTRLHVCRILVLLEKIDVMISLNEVFMHLHVLARIPASVIPAQLNLLDQQYASCFAESVGDLSFFYFDFL